MSVSKKKEKQKTKTNKKKTRKKAKKRKKGGWQIHFKIAVCSETKQNRT